MDPAVLAWALAQAAGSDARNLASAYTSGTLVVRFSDGRSVEYRALADITAAMSALYAASISTASRRPRATLAGFSRGW